MKVHNNETNKICVRIAYLHMMSVCLSKTEVIAHIDIDGLEFRWLGHQGQDAVTMVTIKEHF